MRADHYRTLTLGMALVVATACEPILGPTPTDANWRIQAIGRFTFYVRPGSFAEANLTTLSAVLEDQFAASVSRLDMRYQGHITMFLHNSGADAGFGKEADGGDHSGVAYPETETVKTVCVPPLGGNLFALLSHEANHVIIRNGLGRPGTTFINEGLASAVVSERYHALGPTFYYKWAADNRSRLPRLTDLVDDGKFGAFPQADAYRTSASFLAYAIQVYGVAPLKAVYYATSDEFPGAFRAAYGKPLEEAEAEWKAWVR